MTWRSRAQHLAVGFNTAEAHLAAAYRDVFKAGSEHVELVLADLANHTGFYRVEPPGSDLSQFQSGYQAGQRAAFGRLFSFLSLSDTQLKGLEEAARLEASMSQHEDSI